MSSEESGSVQSDMDSEDYYPLRSNDDGDREVSERRNNLGERIAWFTTMNVGVA